MEKHLLKQSNYFSKMVLCSLKIATIISIALIFCPSIFELNENQLLYLFSAMAQVIGGVFGLTLTAYVFFVDKFERSTNEDDTLYDAAKTILEHHYQILIIIAAICGTVILICVLGIIDLHNWMKIYSFLINEAVFLFLIGISSILAFGVMLLDPKKLDKELQKMKQEAEKDYSSFTTASPDNFLEFLKAYNQLEQLIIKFANVCMEKRQIPSYSTKTNKPRILQAINELGLNEIVGPLLQREINSFRVYRNGLVHGVDFSVTREACDRISKIYDTLKHAYDIYTSIGVESNEWGEAIRQVYDLSR